MNELSLFTGIGGGLLGSKLLGWRTVCAVEKEPYCREVLLRRQRDGVLPLFPIWDDVRTFDGRGWRGAVDVVSAGFPCQPFSLAGKRKGENDERNLWPETIRILCEVRPRYAFLENVPGLLATRYFGRILGDLAENGFNAEWEIVSAADVGAPHLRKRLWILVSDAGCERKSGIQPGGRSRQDWKNKADSLHDGEEEFMAHPKSERWNQGEPISNSMCLSTHRSGESHSSRESKCVRNFWSDEPNVCRVADGISFRVDRLTALGNSQVPGVVAEAWRRLWK